MNKKGFTLVELLAVITIISLLMIVAVPSALNFQENMKKKMFCSKVDTIERAGRLYGGDVTETIKGDKIPERKCSLVTGTASAACQFISVNTLMAKGYLKKELNNTRKDAKVYDEFYDPRDFRSMKSDYVIVYIDNDKAYAKYVFKTKDDSEYCNKGDAEKKTANPSKVFGYYYMGTDGKVKIW